MLSAITRSSYICAQCRSHLLRNVAPGLLHLSLVTNSRRNNSTFLAQGGAQPKHGGAPDDNMDSLVDSFIESAFSNTSLPRRPAPGIGKTDNQRRTLQALPDTWEEAGVRPVVAKVLLDTYPNTARPTDIQKRILQGLKARHSVAVRDLPGTGKSFAIAAWVLGLERAMREPDQRPGSGLSPTTTAFIFVPNADLGIQYYLMIKNLLLASSSRAISSSLDSFVQLLHRRVSNTELQINLLLEKPNPHIIIATPAAALDIISHKSDSVNGLLDFSRATAFVLDEFDALIPRTHPSRFRGWPTLPPGIRGPVPAPPSAPHASIEILLDWVFKRRKMEASALEVKPVQPQLVLSSATLSTLQMTKFIQVEHPLWIGQEGEKSSLSLYDLPEASHLLAIGDESSGVGKIVRAVGDNIVHHAVAYDISTGFMRDAPIPRTAHWETEHITQKLEELKIYEAENAESNYRAEVLKKERDSLALMPLESWDMSSMRAKRAGYPPEIAAEALQNLLEHDKWPRNAIAAIGAEASVRAFIEECAKLRINARELTVDDWNRDMEKEGRIPIGRTDMLFDPEIRAYYKERNERGACRDETIVWVAGSASTRGLDVPGVFHLYILHRLQKAREYTAYCGRVARWPFPTLEKDVKDPRSFGLGVRRGVGKVVSLLLEDHAVPASGLGPSSMSPQIITDDGSDRANWSWLEEGLMVAKIGCHFQDYYGKAGEYPCGPEARTPKPIKPRSPRAAPGRAFNLLDAALGPGPMQEPSLSDPLKEPSSDQVPSGLFGPPQEQPKWASEEAQLEPSTDLPDLPDMLALPFPDGSRDPALSSRAPDSSIFRSPQEDFAQERRASRLPARTNNADDGYREPLKKSRWGQGRGPGKSEAPGRASIFDMLTVQEPGSKYKSPREGFRPDLCRDSTQGKEEKMLSLKALDAEEGYQEPSNEAWKKDFDTTLLPFREAGVEPPKIVEEAEKAGGAPGTEKGAGEERGGAPEAGTVARRDGGPKKASGRVSKEAPKRASKKVSKETLKKASEKVSKEVPEKASKEGPKKASRKVAGGVPEEASGKVVKGVLKKVSGRVSKEGPGKASKVPEEGPKKASRKVVKEVPKEASKRVAKEVPKEARKKVVIGVPKKVSGRVSKEGPGKASKVVKEVPKEASKKVVKEVPKEARKKVVIGVPKIVPEKASKKASK